MVDKTPDLDSWDDFRGEWIKPEFVKKFPCIFVPVAVSSKFDKNEKAQLNLQIQCEARNWNFSLNKTNIDIVKQANLTPRQLIGKKLTMEDIPTRKPDGTPTRGFIIRKIE